MNNVVLSFFKKHSIPYRINRSDNTVIFPCFHCHEETTISMTRTRFHCNNCNNAGSLIHLIEYIKNNTLNTIEDIQAIQIYNEKKEIEDIQTMLAKIEDNQVAIAIQEKLFKIFDKR